MLFATLCPYIGEKDVIFQERNNVRLTRLRLAAREITARY